MPISGIFIVIFLAQIWSYRTSTAKMTIPSGIQHFTPWNFFGKLNRPLVSNFDEKNRDLKMVGGKKTRVSPPPNEFWFFAWNLGLGLRNFMSWNIYSLANFWQIFFRPCTFQPLSIPFWKMKKAKKCKFGQKLHRFQKNWKNRKNLFFSFGPN